VNYVCVFEDVERWYKRRSGRRRSDLRRYILLVIWQRTRWLTQNSWSRSSLCFKLLLSDHHFLAHDELRTI